MGKFARRFAFPLGGELAIAAGPEPVATFALGVEAGARVTYQWRTDVMLSWSGKEKRAGLMRLPRQHYEFTSILTDEQQRLVMAELAGHAADGSAFAIGLAYEDMSIVSVSGDVITVPSLTYCDWAVAGQRAVVVDNEDSGVGTIQSVAGAAITITGLPIGLARPGARIMPAVTVYLDPTQQLSRYAVNAGEWTLVAIASRFRYGESAVLPGVGAAITTFDGFPVWDVGIQTGLASQPMHSGVDLQDLGFSVKSLFTWGQAAWGRTLRIDSSRIADWQWLKRFLHTVRGRHRTFLLPSGRVDLVHVGDASSGTLTIDGVAYVSQWYPSLAHRRLAIVLSDGTVAYRSISAAVDNGDGTQDLTLSAAVAGTIARVEFLELVRLETDDVTIEWGAAREFSCDLMARVVQQ